MASCAQARPFSSAPTCLAEVRSLPSDIGFGQEGDGRLLWVVLLRNSIPIATLPPSVYAGESLVADIYRLTEQQFDDLAEYLRSSKGRAGVSPAWEQVVLIGGGQTRRLPYHLRTVPVEVAAQGGLRDLVLGPFAGQELRGNAPG